MRDLPRRVRAPSRLPGVAEDRLVHRRRGQPRALDRRPRRHLAELRRRQRRRTTPPNLPIGVRAAERTKTGAHRGDRTYQMTGRRTVNVDPLPGALSTVTRPLCASTIQRTIERPRPEPPGLARRDPLAAEEALEDVGQVVLRNADARVRDRQERLARARRRPARGCGRPARVYRSAFSIRLCRTCWSRPASAKTYTGLGGAEASSSQSAVGRRRREVPNDLGREPSEIEVGEGERHAPALAARQEEEVLRDPRQVPHLEQGVPDRLAVLLGRPLLLEGDLERAAQHRQRRAQLVRHVGDELLLLLLGGAQGVEARGSGSRRSPGPRRRGPRRGCAGAAASRSRRGAPSASPGRRGRRRPAPGRRNRSKSVIRVRPSSARARRPARAPGSRRRERSGSASRAPRRRSSCAGR